MMLSGKALVAVEKLGKSFPDMTVAELIEKALVTYAYLHAQAGEGGVVWVRTADGVATEVIGI